MLANNRGCTSQEVPPRPLTSSSPSRSIVGNNNNIIVVGGGVLTAATTRRPHTSQSITSAARLRLPEAQRAIAKLNDLLIGSSGGEGAAAAAASPPPVLMRELLRPKTVGGPLVVPKHAAEVSSIKQQETAVGGGGQGDNGVASPARSSASLAAGVVGRRPVSVNDILQRRRVHWQGAESRLVPRRLVNSAQPDDEYDRLGNHSAVDTAYSAVTSGEGRRRGVGGGGEMMASWTLEDIRDNANTVFDIAIGKAPSSSSSSSSSSSDGSASEGDEDEEHRRRHHDKYSKHEIERMKLEVEQYELSQTLEALVARRHALESERSERERRVIEVQQLAKERIMAHNANKNIVDQEMDAEWKAYRANLDAERRAQRLRSNGDESAASLRKKFYKPRLTSPWQLERPAALDAVVAEAQNQTSKIKAKRRQEAAAMDAAAREVNDDDFKDRTALRDQQVFAGLPAAMRAEILTMRTSEVVRCETSVEPSNRDVLSNAERSERLAIEALVSQGWIAESLHRAQLVALEMEERASLSRISSSEKMHRQVREWTPEITRDKEHLMKKAASEVVPVEVQRQVLAEATEKHRADIRKIWASVLELREKLLHVQRQKIKLKQDIKATRTLLGGKEDGDNDDDEDSSGGGAVSRAVLHRITARQRLAMLKLQLGDVEEREKALKEQIATTDRSW